MKPRGRMIAACTFLLGIVTLAAAWLTLGDRLIEEWDIRRLSDRDAAVRELAARRLGERKGARAVPALVDLFRKEVDHPDSGGEASPAFQALVRIGGPGERALIDAVDDEDMNLRSFALLWINRVSPSPELTIPALTRALRFSDETTRSLALDLLAALGPAARDTVPRLMEILRSRDAEWWLAVASVIWDIDRSAAGLPRALASGLEMANPALKQAAAQYLGELGPMAREAAGALLLVAEDVDGQVRAQVLRALSRVGCDPELLRPFVLRSLRSVEYDARWAAADVARSMPADTRETLPLLIEMLGCDFELLREAATAALLKFGSPAIVELATALEHENPMLREYAAQALGLFGPGAREAVPAITRALRDSGERVRTRAIDALGEIGPAAEAALPDLEAILEKPDEELGVRAARALARMRPAEPALVDFLQRALASTSTGVRAEAALALAHAGSRGDRAIPALEAALNDRNAIVRTFAAWALERIEPGRGRRSKAFTEAFRKPELLLVVAEALAGLPDIGQALLPQLIALSTNKGPVVRIAAARAIGRIGRGARTAIPALLASVRATQKEDGLEFPRTIPSWSDHVELAVTEAIEMIQGSPGEALDKEQGKP